MFFKTAYDSMDPDYGSGSSVGGIGLVFILGMGVILLGVVLMLVMSKIRPEFFKGQVLPRETEPASPPSGTSDGKVLSRQPASAHWKVSTLTNRLAEGDLPPLE